MAARQKPNERTKNQTLLKNVFFYAHSALQYYDKKTSLKSWKREAATGPESRNHLSDPKETKKRLFFSLFPSSTKRLKGDQKETFDPESDSKVTFGAQKVCFWSLLSLFVERGKKSLFSLY